MLKAISLWQPWASLMTIGAKQNETRSWPTSHRGLLAIHAAKRKMTNELRDNPYYKNVTGGAFFFPYGVIVAVVDVYSCRGTNESKGLSEQEKAFGDYSPGRFYWVTHNPRKINPVPCRGFQGIWTLDAVVEDQVMAQL